MLDALDGVGRWYGIGRFRALPKVVTVGGVVRVLLVFLEAIDYLIIEA